MKQERESYLSPDGKPIIFIRTNSHRAALELPGVVISRIELPLTLDEQEDFALTAINKAIKMKNWLRNNGNHKLNPDLLKRLDIISSQQNYQPAEIFEWITTETSKDFDVIDGFI